jgi:hypothetical protein
MLLPASGWRSKEKVEESGTDIGRQPAGIEVLSDPIGIRRAVKESETLERIVLPE